VSHIKKRGEYIGEIAVLLNIGASATVKAETEIDVIEIESANITSFFKHKPEIAIGLARKMAERLAGLNAKFAQLIDKSYKPDFITQLQKKQKQEDPKVISSETINLEKLKSYFVNFPAGKQIIYQGFYPDALYILVSGVLEIIKNDKIIAVEDKPGYYLGDVAILRNTFSNASVITRTPTTLIHIGLDKVESFLNHSPDIALSIAVKLAERTIAINDLFLNLQVDAMSEYLKDKENKLRAEKKNKAEESHKMSKEICDLLEIEYPS
jgi:CRP-like cAMP-binding protein